MPLITVRFSEEIRDNLSELNAAVESLETHPTYFLDDVFDWMHTWGTEDEKPFDQTKAIPSKHSI